MRPSLAFLLLLFLPLPASAADRPNILFAISDDQSWPHASAYGCTFVETPGFDRVAREGALFHNAFAPSPGCSPTRASILTGRHIWQIEHAGTHASSFPAKYTTYPDLLEAAGYVIGGTGKLWSPGNHRVDGRTRNPAGPSFDKRKLQPPAKGIRSTDYAENFADFLKQRPADKPFHFWYGASEPHRGFEKGVGLREGKKLEDAQVPGFLPDLPEVRGDLLDYAVEIEWFDRHLARMLELLEEAGELDNTLVIVTSDNGMSFPRAKANLYEHGVHMPLAIRWGARAKPGREIRDLVGFVDLTATMLEVAGVEPPTDHPPAGRSILPLLLSEKSGWIEPETRAFVLCGRERHSSSRWRSLGYPQRAIRTADYLYIHNPKPERWPAGAPRRLDGPMHRAYHDIDACPTLDAMVARADDPEFGKYLQWSVAKRPREELFLIKEDPDCLNNLAEDPEHRARRDALREQLMTALKATGDPRVTGNGDVFETYKRYSHLRRFPKPEWATEHPERVPEQDWVKE